jgi:hypothetical protein
VKRALVTGAAATLLWLVVANSVPSKQARAADWSHPKRIATSSGITATYPRGWIARREAGPSLAFSSFALPADWWFGDRKTIPEGGVFIWLYISGPRSNGFPERPGHFELRDEDHRFLSCGLGFEGWNVIFVDHSVTVQTFVGLGPGARKSDAAELLDRLAIRRSSPSLART